MCTSKAFLFGISAEELNSLGTVIASETKGRQKKKKIRTGLPESRLSRDGINSITVTEER